MMTLGRHYCPTVIAAIEARTRTSEDGLPVSEPTAGRLFGVADEADLLWMRERLTAHPAKTWEQELKVGNATAPRLPRSYIICPNEPGIRTWYASFAEHIQQEGGDCHELAGGHDVMVTMPEALSALLSTLAMVTRSNAESLTSPSPAR